MMKLNHVGIATNDIEKLANEYVSKGYMIVNKVFDNIQLADLYLLRKNNSVDIELVYTSNPNSKVYNLSINNYNKQYHKCYEVENIKNEIELLKKDNYTLISDINDAILLNGKVCFLYKNGELIELVERYE